MADIVVDTIANKFPPVTNFKEGSQFINIADSKLYILENNDWVELRSIIPGEYYRVKSLNNSLFKVNDILGLQRVELQDISDTKTLDKDTEKNIINYFLKNYSPKTANIFKDNNITFSSMEILLPIILDNYKSYIDKSNFSYRQGQREINDWLIQRGFIKDNVITDKEVSTEDLRDFAVVLCKSLSLSGKLSDSTLGYDKLLGEFLNTDFNINIKGVDNSYSLRDILEKLRSQEYLYSNKKDIILRNIINHDFASDTFGISNGRGSTVPFNQLIMSQLTISWFNLINKNSLLNKLDNNDFIKQNYGVKLSQLNQKDINCWDFYTSLKTLYEDLLVKNIEEVLESDDVIKDLEVIIKDYNPDSLIFLVERLMEEATNINVQQKRESLDLNEIESSLKSSYVVFANSKEKLNNLKKLKSLINKFGFSGYDSRADLKVNPNMYRTRNNELIEDKKLIIPKTLDVVDTDAWKYLLIPEAEVNRSRIDQRLEALDEGTLASVAESLRNEYVIDALNKYYTSSYMKDYLKEKGVKLEDKDYDYIVNYKDNLYNELEKVTDLVKETKPIVQRAQALVDAVVSQKQNRPIDDQLKVSDVSVTELQSRDMLKNIRFCLDSLGTYIKNYKNNNLEDISFNELVSDMKSEPEINNLFVINYVGLVNLLKGELTDNFEKLTQLLAKFNNIDEINLENITDQKTLKQLPPMFIQEAKDKASDLVSYIERAVMNVLGDKQSKSKLIKEDTELEESQKELDTMLQSLGTYNKFVGLLRYALKEVNANDVEDFLKNLQQKDNVMIANKNALAQELNKDMSLLYTTARSIVSLLNLSDITKIRQSVQDLIAQADKYKDIYPSDINTDFIRLNFNELVNIIEDILTEKDTRYSYDSILKNILEENKDLFKVKIDPVDIQNPDLFNIFQELKVEVFNSDILQSIIEAGTKNNLDLNANSIVGYVANKLFYKYRQSLGGDKDVAKTSFIEYLDYQKFNLALDVADNFSNGSFSNTLKSLQLDAIDQKYFMNAETVFSRLKNQRLYRTVPDNVIKAMANYKVLDYINISLYNQIQNSSILKQLLDDCEAWDFSDKLISNVLPNCVLFDVKGNVIDTQNSSDLLTEVRANIVKPLEYRYLNTSDNIFRSIFNKLKDLNKYSLRKNAVAAARLISSVVYQKGSIKSAYNYITKSINDKLGDKTLDVNLVNELKAIDSELKTQVTDIETCIQKIYNIADAQLKQDIPDIKSFISETVSNDPILQKYTSIKLKYDKLSDKYSLIEDSSTDILPVEVMIDKALIQSEQNKQLANFTDEDKKKVSEIINKLDTVYDVLSKTFYNAMAKNLSDSKINSAQLLLHKTELIKNQLNNKISSKTGKTLITNDIVESHVQNLKDGLEAKLMTVSKKSDECFDLTDKLSTLLSDVNLKIEKTKTLLV